MSTQFAFECMLFTQQAGMSERERERETKRKREKKDHFRFKYVNGSLETGNSVYRFKKLIPHRKVIAQTGCCCRCC